MWAHGLRGEQCAAIFSQNDARVLCCMLGIMRAGAVWVPINYRNAIDANVEYMNYAKMAWLFYHSDFKDSVEEFRDVATAPQLRRKPGVESSHLTLPRNMFAASPPRQKRQSEHTR